MTFLDDERRKNERLLRYWDQLRGERPFPSEDDLDLDELMPLWDACFVLQARDVRQKVGYNYTYLGGTIQQAYQRGLIPFSLKGMVSLEASHLSEEFEQVFAQPQPLYSEGEHALPEHQILRYRQIILPLSHGKGTVEALLGHVGFRIYRDNEAI
jgi:hypothetical protein